MPIYGPNGDLLTVQAATLRDPIEDWLRDAFNGRDDDTGVNVTYNTAITYVSLWAAVSLISKDVAKVPLAVMNLEDDGDRMPNWRHPVTWLLNNDANRHMSALTFRMLLQSHVLLWGNGYAFIARDPSQRPTSLIPLLPDRTKPVVDDEDNLFYEVMDEGKPSYYPARDIFHLKGLCWDGYRGHSVISVASRQIGMAIGQEKHGATSMKNGAKPSIVLETDQRLSREEADQLLSRWEERHGGPDNQNRPALLTHALKVKPFSMSNEDVQWLESREFSRTDVAHWFNLPPHKISQATQLPYNSLIAAEQAYRNDTLSFWYRQWEVEAERKLLSDRVRRSRQFCVCHDLQELDSADVKTRMDIWEKARQMEVMSPNEIRQRLGLPSREGGDDFTNPNVRSPSSRTTTDDNGDESRAAMRAAMADRLKALIIGEGKRAENAAKTAKDFVSWTDNFYQNFEGQMADAIEPLIYAYSTLPGVTVVVTSAEVSQQYAQRSKEELLAVAGIALDRDELKTHVTETVAEWPQRAEEMAAQICEASYVPSQ